MRLITRQMLLSIDFPMFLVNGLDQIIIVWLHLCHNIARNLPITIDKPDKQLKLLYIDDLVNQLIHLPKYTSTNDYFYEVHPTYSVSLERISVVIFISEYDMDPYIPDRMMSLQRNYIVLI